MYVAVGLGVLGYQRAQVYRRACQSQLGRAAARSAEQLRPVSERVARRLPPEANDMARAAGDVVNDISSEAKELAKEALAFGRFALQLLKAPAARPGSGG